MDNRTVTLSTVQLMVMLNALGRYPLNVRLGSLSYEDTQRAADEAMRILLAALGAEAEQR